MSNTAYWEINEATGEVEELDDYRDYGSEVDSSRPAKGERDRI